MKNNNKREKRPERKIQRKLLTVTTFCITCNFGWLTVWCANCKQFSIKVKIQFENGFIAFELATDILVLQYLLQ